MSISVDFLRFKASLFSRNFAPEFQNNRINMTRFLLVLTWLTMMFAGNASAQIQRKLTVDELFNLVEQNSKTLKEQKTGVEVANAGVAVAKSQRLPDINASLSASYNGNALLMNRHFGEVHGLHSPHFGNSFALEAQQVVYAGGAIDAGIKMAELQKEQAGLATDLQRENLRFIALGQYLDLAKIANREEVLRSNIALTQKLIDNINEKHQQGVALKNDVTRYELQMQTLRLNLTKLQNTRSILNHQLCNTLGLDTNTYIETDKTIEQGAFAKDGEGAWQSEALLGAQSVKMADVNKNIADQQLKLAKSAMLPSVAVVAANKFDGPIMFELPPVDKNLNVWYVGVGVKYSLSSLFKDNKKVRQAKIATRKADEARSVAVETLNNNVQQAYTDYLQSYVELETQQKNVELAQQNYDVINDRYLNQLALITDMLDASNTKLDAELSVADARINIAYAYYKMKFIAGKL